ncbi:MAG: DUF4476 domain-containing protein [Capnocytophaga sp.]|nr:DUF4476 domain-containing protein [Capnocytophaga sp.]
MKNISLLLILIPFVAVAQEMGTAGKRLQNENRRNVTTEENAKVNYHYRWETTYEAGYAEVFVRIPEMGRFTISLGEQEISNSNGMFRFFDVPALTQELSIWHGRKLLYRVTITPRDNTRLVLDFFSEKGLYLLEELELNDVRQVYGRQWNDVWNHSYGARTMRQGDFNTFFRMFKEQSFDDDKLRFFRTQKNVTAFTTQQIASMMENISFDNNRLILAKEAYTNVLDPENYYILHDNFSFKDTARKFSEFLERENSRR